MEKEKLKQDFNCFINEVKKGLDNDCLCLYCKRCVDSSYPDDCDINPDNEDCLDAFEEMVSESKFEKHYLYYGL